MPLQLLLLLLLGLVYVVPGGRSLKTDDGDTAGVNDALDEKVSTPAPAPCYTFDGDCAACVAARDNRARWSGKCLQLDTTIVNDGKTRSCVPSSWWLEFNTSYHGAHSCNNCNASCPKIPKPVPSCTSASDCHLLGDCIGGKCICDEGWVGERCGQLDLAPVDRNERPGLAFPANATWGASPVKGKDGTWRVAHAQMRSHCGIFQAWMTNSFIALSVSSGGVGGPYHYEKALIPTFSHNPQVRQLPDGTYAMFFIGGWPETPCECKQPDDGTKCPAQNSPAPNVTLEPAAAAAGCSVGNWSKEVCPDEMPGRTKDCCGPNHVTNFNGPDTAHYWRLNTGCGIATSTATSIEGPWSAPQPLVIEDAYRSDNVYCTHTNPSPVFLKNGSVVMAFNAGCCDPHCSENVGTAISDNGIGGPWRLLSRNSIFETSQKTAFYPKGIGHGCEDPFLWHSKRGWHMLVHNFAPIAPGVNPQIAYGYSIDGRNWTLSKEPPADCTLKFTDNTSIELPSCGNRPQLAFDSDGVTPLGLFGGVTGSPRTKPGGGSGEYTSFRPVRKRSP